MIMFDHKKTTTHAHKIEMDAQEVSGAVSERWYSERCEAENNRPTDDRVWTAIPDSATLSTNSKGNLIIEWTEKETEGGDDGKENV